MAWHRTGDTPLSELLNSLVNWRIYASIGLDGFPHKRSVMRSFYPLSVCQLNKLLGNMMKSSNRNNFRVADPFWEKPQVTRGFPSQRASNAGFNVSFDVSLNKLLNKQPRRRWCETPRCLLQRHCNDQSSYAWFEPPWRLCGVSVMWAFELTIGLQYIALIKGKYVVS